MPSSGPELKTWLDARIRDIIANVLMLGGADEVDGALQLLIWALIA